MNLLQKFEKWLEMVKSDHEANVQTKLANDLLPIRRLYKEAIRHDNGKALEAVWMVSPATV